MSKVQKYLSIFTGALLGLSVAACNSSGQLENLERSSTTIQPTTNSISRSKQTHQETIQSTQKTKTHFLPIPPTATNTPPQITATPTPTPLPEEHYIKNIRGHKQFYPLGCEARVAVDWAAFFGYKIIESEFQLNLPLSDNPDYGFVGSVNGPWGQVPPYAYGIHAGPVATLLREYGLKAKDVKGFILEELKEHIANDRPVIAWVIGDRKSVV